MRRILLFILFITLIGVLGCEEEVNSSNQQKSILTEEKATKNGELYTRETEHIKFYYYEKNADYIEDMAETIEEEYDRIVEDLQVDNIDEKINFTIYPTLEEFHQAIFKPDAPDWVVGTCLGPYTLKMVSPNSDGLVHDYNSLMNVVIHEFTHALTMIQYPQAKQIWILEAIALYEANQIRDPKDVEYLVEGDYPSIQELNASSGKSAEKVYAIGHIIIEYINEKWSMDEVRELLKENGDIEKVLGVTEGEFEKGFYKYMEDKYLGSN
ncbi:hypothetical protein GOQ27_08270 [Clostridium sp. D2Q-11]|uniref:Peptidase MA superfamily protein n=1 Tax=Anaeromonas frigoriresistens TaxID=2683708 RepID=A0A942V1V0_9FIRM|nr:hypothetical protein [Anaeromonas frigoriresistens]MBS4538457.1 hypothetical protein [Anaeromonas frigoriresistens]